jgi:hypothetical protein
MKKIIGFTDFYWCIGYLWMQCIKLHQTGPQYKWGYHEKYGKNKLFIAERENK